MHFQKNFNINYKIKYHPGKCECSSTNWSGDLCDECAPKFFGPLCLPLFRFFSIFPTSGPNVGGTEIYVLGNNLPNVPTYICRFRLMSYYTMYCVVLQKCQTPSTVRTETIWTPRNFLITG